jgi:hypothetical protein
MECDDGKKQVAIEVNQERLRWCPDCGQVEIDNPEVNLQIIRRGDARCTRPIEEWVRGTAEDRNRYFGARFERVWTQRKF